MSTADSRRAQFLLCVYQGANEFADEIDPLREEKTRYDQLAEIAAEEFCSLTGEHPAVKSTTN